MIPETSFCESGHGLLHRRIYRLIERQHLFLIHYLVDEKTHKASQVSSFLTEHQPYVEDYFDNKKELNIELNLLSDSRQSVM